MFITLLIVNFITSFVVCVIVAQVFKTPIDKIMQRLVAEEIYVTWRKYLIFAIYVVGLSGGVRIWELEKYITPKTPGETILELTSERWVLEVYGTVIGTLQSNAWMLLLFFIFALIAFVIVKGLELKKKS